MNDKKTHKTNKGGRPKNSGTKARPLTDKEVKRLLGACYGAYGLRNRSIIMLGLCGLRIGTIMKLKQGDIIGTNGKVKTDFVLDASKEKSKRTHRYYVSKQARTMLEDYLKTLDFSAEAPLFPSPKTKGFMSSSAGSRLISNLLEKAEIYDNSSHCLRKSFSHKAYVEHSVGLVELSRLLNHTSPTTTAKSYIGDLTPNLSKVMEQISY